MASNSFSGKRLLSDQTGVPFDLLAPESKRPCVVDNNSKLASPSSSDTGSKAESSNSSASSVAVEVVKDAFGVPGLFYYPEFISSSDEQALIEAIDAGTWDNTLKRRVQHFGMRYDYSSKSIDRNSKLDPLPDFMIPLVDKLTAGGVFEVAPDQCIVNGTCG